MHMYNDWHVYYLNMITFKPPPTPINLLPAGTQQGVTRRYVSYLQVALKKNGEEEN